ncbi:MULTISPECIES: hypothetical protein [Okeania]|uniref:hypothetical protein n=1 Tax=Okeania TaxID=1458928 RepID=UPI0013751475|nr:MULTISPECIES: hypothetical protein [Okeania]NET22266.1 hypothetical protein [Okeania sp. SIO1H5]
MKFSLVKYSNERWYVYILHKTAKAIQVLLNDRYFLFAIAEWMRSPTLPLSRLRLGT